MWFGLLLCPLALAGRTVVIPDLHADFKKMKKVLHVGGVLNTDDSWALGRDDALVFLGDLSDRGPNSLACYDELDKLGEQANAAGTKFIRIMGNHELMNLQGDYRYVSKDDLSHAVEVDARGSIVSTERGYSLLQKGGSQAMAAWNDLFHQGGQYYQKIMRSFVPVAKHDDTVFVHAGISPQYAKPVEQLAEEAMTAIRGQNWNAGVLGNDGPFWYRGLSLLEIPESRVCKILDHVLPIMGAKRMVVGHTIMDHGVTTRCGGKIVLADVGMSEALSDHTPTTVELNAQGAFEVTKAGRRQLESPVAS